MLCTNKSRLGHELEDLLRRYPALEEAELGRLLQLYREASAEEMLLISAHPEHGPKALRLSKLLYGGVDWLTILVTTGLVVALFLLATLG